MTQLAGRLAVVTGASRGIGLATAYALRNAGATVVRMARSLTPGTHQGFHDFPCDLADVRAIVGAATGILNEWGTPHIVVSNAGAFLLKPFEATQPEELDEQLRINIRAPYLLAQQLLPTMRAAGQGLFVHLGSVTDHRGFADNTAYAASKYALRGLHETLVAEYRGSGVRFTLISPGATDTAAWDPVDPDTRPGFLARTAMLRPDDVADAVVFVATRPPHVSIDWLRIQPSAS